MKCKRCGKEFISLHIEELDYENCLDCEKKIIIYEIDNLVHIGRLNKEWFKSHLKNNKNK